MEGPVFDPYVRHMQGSLCLGLHMQSCYSVLPVTVQDNTTYWTYVTSEQHNFTISEHSLYL
jgi:hypothetical protein